MKRRARVIAASISPVKRLGLLALVFAFALQAYFSFQLVALLTGKKVIALLCSFFFILASPFLIRNMGHFALGSHWVILAALYLYFQPRWRKWMFFVLLLTSSLIHAYLLTGVKS